MLSLRACHLTGVSLTLDVGYVLTAVATDLGCRVSPLGHVSLQLCEATSHCSSFFSITCWGIDLDYHDTEWFALEMNRDRSVVFEIASKYCISDSFVDHDGHSISSEGFLSAVVDIMVI